MEKLSNKRSFGGWGETIAAEYLERNGYQIIARNYHCRMGEIDLIAKDGPVWCFIEVKTRRGPDFGYGYEAVTSVKRKHLVKAAMTYLATAGLSEVPARFDVVSIDFITHKDYRISLFKNAFAPEST
ncbi:MAG: YraN family protein [Firmicutes bacterium]|nr:YraN family protein [Bacillota bacterium]